MANRAGIKLLKKEENARAMYIICFLTLKNMWIIELLTILLGKLEVIQNLQKRLPKHYLSRRTHIEFGNNRLIELKYILRFNIWYIVKIARA
jgi:hypothetical protein